MLYRKLGETDIRVSVMALGCWPFAGGVQWGDQDDNDSIATVHACLDNGVNFFDTAEGYGDGRSERVLGQALRDRRASAVIATKASPNHLSAEDIVLACEGSLRNLGTDYIDLYQIHWPSRSAVILARKQGKEPGREVPLEETVAALERLKRQGKVRAIGVSNFGVQDLAAIQRLTRIVTDQVPYSLLWRAIEHEIKPACVKSGTGIICYSPLAQGLLTGRYKNEAEVPEGVARMRLFSNKRQLARHSDPGAESSVFEALRSVSEIADGLGKPMAAVALAWVRQRRGVTSFLVGARKPDELRWNLPAVHLRLGADAVRRLNAATEPVKRYVGTNPDPWDNEPKVR